MRRRTSSRALLLASVLGCLVVPAWAHCSDAERYLGLGLRIRPAYDGADSHRTDPIPYVRLYGRHLFARTTQGLLEGGWRTTPYGAWTFGAQAAYEEGRVTDESAFLKAYRLQDLDAGASVGLHAEGDWKIGSIPLNALVRYRQNVDTDRGAQADLRVSAGIFSRWSIEAGLYGQLTWASGKFMQSYFGITPLQSAATGLPIYAAGSGFRTLQGGVLGAVELSPRWLIPWSAGMQRLTGDAGNSPITQERTTWSANAGIAYRF